MQTIIFFVRCFVFEKIETRVSRQLPAEIRSICFLKNETVRENTLFYVFYLFLNIEFSAVNYSFA